MAVLFMKNEIAILQSVAEIGKTSFFIRKVLK